MVKQSKSLPAEASMLEAFEAAEFEAKASHMPDTVEEAMPNVRIRRCCHESNFGLPPHPHLHESEAISHSFTREHKALCTYCREEREAFK